MTGAAVAELLPLWGSKGIRRGIQDRTEQTISRCPCGSAVTICLFPNNSDGPPPVRQKIIRPATFLFSSKVHSSDDGKKLLHNADNCRGIYIYIYVLDWSFVGTTP